MAIRRIRSAWRTITGLVTLLDVLGFIGFWLFRGTMRRTVAVAVALLVVSVVGSKSDAAYALTLNQAMHGTGLIFVISCVGGAALMIVSGSFSKAALTVAEAKGFNLLEDMKRSRASLHRERLWRRVYRYEPDAADPAGIERERGALAAHGESLARAADAGVRDGLDPASLAALDAAVGSLGVTEAGWGIIFDQATGAPMPLAVLNHRYRYRLAKVRDWYDGAPFHGTDWKLATQFAAVEDLQEAKRDAGLGRWAAIDHVRMRWVQQLWFRMITRAVQVRVAAACRRLDERYAPYRFSIDHFLWPGPQIDAVVLERLGGAALDELTALRRTIFQTVFHRDVTLAHQLMRKAIYPNFAAATRLRMAFDPQYVCDDLAERWAEDLHRYDRALGRSRRAMLRRQRRRRDARRRQHDLAAYLRRRPDLRPTLDPRRLRALRIAQHVNLHGLRDLIERDADAETRAAVDRAIAMIVGETEHLTQKLLAVRLHHELARLELEDYELYLERIMASGDESTG